MRIHALTRLRRAVTDGVERLRYRASGGMAEVVALKCTDCGRWVPADAWNPITAVCEVCTSYRLRAATVGRLATPAAIHPVTETAHLRKPAAGRSRPASGRVGGSSWAW